MASKPPKKPAKPTLVQLLRDAQACVTRGELSAALRTLLQAWGMRRVGELADVIDAVGRAAGAAIAPPSGETPKLRRAAWDALLAGGDPAAIGPLLATITETRSFAETWERFGRLDRADPRVDQRVADLIEVPAYNPDGGERTDPIWNAMFAMIESSRDPRMVERVRGFEASWQANRDLSSWRLRGLRHRRDSLAARVATPTALSRAESAACAAIVAALPVQGRVAIADDLLAAIYRAPDDDGPRAVYMDWLLERGDPRGELIALQLARAAGEAGNPKREHKLLAQHATLWLGSLATKLVTKTMRFERGFLAACTLREPLHELDEDRGWATVREVAGGVPRSDGCQVPALRVLQDVDGDGIKRLATLRTPLAVEELHWNGPVAWIERPEDPDYMRDDGHVALAALEQIRVLPRLRRLELRGHAWNGVGATLRIDELLRVCRAPCAANLETLVFPGWFGLLPHVIELFEPRALPAIELCSYSGPMWYQGWHAVLSRGSRNKLSRLRIVGTSAGYSSAIHYSYGHEVIAALEVLDPAGFESVEVEVPEIAWDTAETQLLPTLRPLLARFSGTRLGPAVS